MTRAFIDLVLEEGERCGGSVSKLTSRAVYLLCWLNRYQKDLFPDWKAPEVAVFLQFGRCASDTGALFLQLLARLPVDVLLLLPNLNEGSALHTRICWRSTVPNPSLWTASRWTRTRPGSPPPPIRRSGIWTG